MQRWADQDVADDGAAEQGPDAAELVVVDVDPLPPVVGTDAALADETLLFPEVGTNLVAEAGAPDGATAPDGPAGCEVVVRQRMVNQRLAACPLEVRSSAAAWDGGRLVVWCSKSGDAPYLGENSSCLSELKVAVSL